MQLKNYCGLDNCYIVLGLKSDTISVIYEDDEVCELLSKIPVYHQKTKHIDIRHHFIRYHTQNNKV